MKTSRTRVPSRPAPGPFGRRRHRHRPAVEALEGRELLSLTVTVNTTSDADSPTDGVMSLRQAIELCNANGDPALLAQLNATERALVTVYPTATPAPGAPPPPNTIQFNLPG